MVLFVWRTVVGKVDNLINFEIQFHVSFSSDQYINNASVWVGKPFLPGKCSRTHTTLLY